MKERPILFSAPMVRAILAGTKTQTRRIVRLPRWLAGGDLDHAWPDKMWGVTPGLHVSMPDDTQQRLRNPWMWPEPSLLWVRETWQGPLFSGELPDDWRSEKYNAPKACHYRASGDSCEFVDMDDNLVQRWRPSIHMPRWASRITLEITGVRVERLQNISEVDAKAEGVDPIMAWRTGEPVERFGLPRMTPVPVMRYARLWESINGPGSWAANPWVWVVEFKRVGDLR